MYVPLHYGLTAGFVIMVLSTFQSFSHTFTILTVSLLSILHPASYPVLPSLVILCLPSSICYVSLFIVPFVLHSSELFFHVISSVIFALPDPSLLPCPLPLSLYTLPLFYSLPVYSYPPFLSPSFSVQSMKAITFLFILKGLPRLY